MSINPYSAASLKRGAWDFLSGKALTGVLTFCVLLALVRLLPIAEYGVYATLLASAELAYAIASFGLPWACARFIPDFRLNSTYDRLRHFVLRTLLWQVFSLASLCLGVAAFSEVLTGWLDLHLSREAFWIWLSLIFVEGISRFSREGILGPLVQQRSVRASLVSRQAVFLTLILVLSFGDAGALLLVLSAELVAALVGLLLALVGMRQYRAHFQTKAAGYAKWQEPTPKSVMRTALAMYLAHLLSLAYSPQLFVVLLQRYAGAEAAAVFGFLRSIYDQVARNLPATLLFGLVRPKLVAAYVGGGGALELTRNANLAGKLSLFALMPILIVTFVAGDEVIHLLSAGKFEDAGLLLFALMLSLIPFSQRQLLETVAVATGNSALCPVAATSGLLILPAMLVFLQTGLGVWVGVIGLISGHLVFALIVVVALERRVGYVPDYLGLAKLAFAAFAACSSALVTHLLPLTSEPWTQIMVSTGLGLALFLLVSWVIKPFGLHERARLNSLIGRKLVVW